MELRLAFDIFLDGQKIASFSAESITKKPPANKKVYGRVLVVFWEDFGQSSVFFFGVWLVCQVTSTFVIFKHITDAD